jgi:glycosyltransferase involved in cell wall biosynthesis
MTLRILFDGQIFVGQRAGGISRYYTTLARQLGRTGGVSARIVAPLHRNEILREDRSAPVFGVGLPDRRGVDRICRYAQDLVSPLVDPFFRGDIVHETFFSPRAYLTHGRRRVTTMYDMITELYYPGDVTTEHKKASLDRSDHVICISRNTRKDLCEIFDVPLERTSVTHLSYEDFGGFKGSKAPDALGGSPYFFYVGNRASYKNFEALLRAFASVPELVNNFRIACYGGRPFTGGERAAAAALGLRPEALVHLTGGDDVLGAGYANATAFVYPSLYEGFGIPPLEAMSASCPVLSSNTSSLPEVVGDAALSFDPKDVEALRDALVRVAESSDLRADLVRRGHAQRALFSWDRCVEQTLAVYRSIL